MHLKHLALIQFKNYKQAELQLVPGVNCFTGPNGSGKTNLLDAVHYLSMCRSYLNPVDKQNIRFGESFFVVQGTWQDQTNEVSIHCGVKAGHRKVIKRNKVEYEKLADHIGQFPAVMISPYDRDLIAEGSEIRRKWMDGIIAQSDRAYLEALQRYVRVLDQRNALLKQFWERGLFEPEPLEVWDEQLVRLGELIHKTRKQFLDDFLPVFHRYYHLIGLEEEQVELEYRSQLNEEGMQALLIANRRKDAQSHYTNAGVHKDDILFTIRKHPVKKFGSQGQQKSFIIALRLAQFEWLTEHLGKKPVLMLDDIFDKLDEHRVSKLMSLVSDGKFGQVLITDTDETRVRKLFSEIQVEINHIAVNELEIPVEVHE